MTNQPVVAAASPRTSREPMAFTPWEFWRGALFSIVAFQPLVIAAVLVHGLITAGGSTISYAAAFVMYVPAFALPVSVIAWMAFVGPAYVVGRSLRRVPAKALHLVAFGGFGLLIGMGISVAVGAVLLGAVEPGTTAALALACTVAIVWGWTFTMRRALRSDRGVGVPSRDADALVEDAALDARAT